MGRAGLGQRHNVGSICSLKMLQHALEAFFDHLANNYWLGRTHLQTLEVVSVMAISRQLFPVTQGSHRS
jgi:hypothetical protein